MVWLGGRMYKMLLRDINRYIRYYKSSYRDMIETDVLVELLEDIKVQLEEYIKKEETK